MKRLFLSFSFMLGVFSNATGGELCIVEGISTVVLENKPDDALDHFVKSWSRTNFKINTLVFLVMAAFHVKHLPVSPDYTFDQQYLILSIAGLGVVGVLDLCSRFTYYVYSFLRGGIEAIAPRKIVKSVRGELLLLEVNFPRLIGLAGALCSILTRVRPFNTLY
jgi:hypothetical protein